MNERRDNFPRPSDFPRLADAYSGDGFPEHGPWTPLSAAVLADALEALRESRGPGSAAGPPQEVLDKMAARGMRELTRRQAQTRAAKEIEAAWHDPHWLDEH